LEAAALEMYSGAESLLLEE